MIQAAFEYRRATSLDDALKAIAGGDAKVLAGGMSLLPLMKLRLASPGKLVDIGRLTELKGVRRLDDGRLAIGALTTYAELLQSPASNYGLLRDALPIIGDVQVRNRGTVGGSIAHADPASDLPACLLALDAELVARSSTGERTIPVDGFLEGAFTTGLQPDEILTEIRLPGPRDDAGSAYVSLQNKASGYAIVGVAAVVFSGDGRAIGSANVAVTGVGDVAYRARAVESALAGSDGSPGAIAAAAEHASDGLTINSDIHA
ncbi:MAG: xanthine dehydrogenase family protein subunit M, partial [Chloroflexi bacterium]|nr:xanthine dehydrogenase family protein subunit M [Chloroflexota bacterium]